MREFDDVLTDERLPLASGPRVTGKLGIGLETEFAVERGFDFTLITRGTREESAAELSFNEELAVEDTRGGVEGSAWNSLIHMVGCCDSVTRTIDDRVNKV